MSVKSCLINGQWASSTSAEFFSAINPVTGQQNQAKFPISSWGEISTALSSAKNCWNIVCDWPGNRFAEFLNRYADLIEQNILPLAEIAHTETGLPVDPRLKSGEIPRTISQLRVAAKSAAVGSWRNPIIDTKNKIRSMLNPIGPVLVFGPNNFPFAYNSISGGDFAAAIAAGNPVLAKGHPSHPETTYRLAELAKIACDETGMPPGFVQLIYHMQPVDGMKLIGDPVIKGIGFTGSRQSGVKIKELADKLGKPVYLEMSSINPVVMLPGALTERLAEVISEFTSSCLMGTGQFCTNPGLVFVYDEPQSQLFIKEVSGVFAGQAAGTMLSPTVKEHFLKQIKFLQSQGVETVTGGNEILGNRIACENTLLTTTGDHFLSKQLELQQEAFGNSSLIVVVKDTTQLLTILETLEGNLTGSIYSARSGADDENYLPIERVLRQKVGRLLNDKMPTGVAVSPAMNHGGPFPATGHPGFTAVGIPASIKRFAMLTCYDCVRHDRLPLILQDNNPHAELFREIDGMLTTGDVT